MRYNPNVQRNEQKEPKVRFAKRGHKLKTAQEDGRGNAHGSRAGEHEKHELEACTDVARVTRGVEHEEALAVLCALLDVVDGAVQRVHSLLSVRVREWGVALGDGSPGAGQRDWIRLGKRAYYIPFCRGARSIT